MGNGIEKAESFVEPNLTRVAAVHSPPGGGLTAGCSEFPQEPLPPDQPAGVDPYTLILLAERARIGNRRDQAEKLIEVAYKYYDQYW